MILFADPITSVDGAAALAACIEHCLADGAGAAVFGVIPDVRVGAQELCTAMQRHGLAADELDLGQCATSYITAVEAVEGCSLEDAVKTGSCRLARWVRRSPSSPHDEGSRLACHFRDAMGMAEAAVDRRMRASGYTREE